MKKIVHKTFLLLLLNLILMSCTPPAYICPLKDLPGKCSSQMDAYQATLRNDATGDSIFESQHERCDLCTR